MADGQGAHDITLILGMQKGVKAPWRLTSVLVLGEVTEGFPKAMLPSG